MDDTFSIKQSKFNAGEMDPSLYGEVSNPKYPASVKLCKNWIPTPQGALRRRPGTRFIAPVKDSSYSPRLVPFVFSDNQAFALEIGNAYARFFKTAKYVGNDGLLHVNGDATPRYELGTPFSTPMLDFLTWAQTGNTITFCYGGQVVGTAAIAPQDLVHATNALIPWAIGATPLKIPSTSLTLAPVVNILAWNNATPYKAGDMASRQNVLWVSIQSNNLNNDPSPAAPVLNATGDQLAGTIWWQPAIDKSHAARTVTWGTTVVVQDPNGITYETLLGATVSGTGPLSLDRVVPLIPIGGIAPGLPAGWSILYGKMYRAESGGVFGWIGDIPAPLGIPSTTYSDIGNAANYAIQPPQGTDPFLIAAAGTDSYPSVVGYLDQRRIWCDSLLLPSSLWLSKIGDLYNYDSRNSPGADTDAMNLMLNSDVLEQIRAFVPKRRGLVMTSQGEWAIAGQGGGPISRSSQDAKKQSDHGSSWLRPLKIGTGILFNTAKANMVRDLYPLYGLYADIWDGQDLTVLARHLFDLHTLKDWAFQSTPYPLAWACREDGTFLSLTYQHAPPSFGQQLTDGVVAWAQHTTGSGSDLFERVCVVPEPPEDAVYLQTKRTFVGTSVRWIERMESPIPPASPFKPGVPDVRYGCYLDAAVQYDGHNLNTAAKASIVSVLHPGSNDPADYTAGSQVIVTVGVAAPFSGADVSSPNGVLSDFYFDPENLNGQGVASGKVIGFTSTQVVTVQLDTNLTTAQIATWKAGNANWALARGFIFATHLTGYPIDSNDVVGTRGVMCLVDGDQTLPDIWAAGLAWLPNPGIVIFAGIAYNSDLKPLDAWAPSIEIRNKFKNLIRVGFELAYTRDLWVGQTESTLTQWQQRTVTDSFGVLQPTTGYDEEFVYGDSNKAGELFIRHFAPLPATIASILREMKLGDT